MAYKRIYRKKGKKARKATRRVKKTNKLMPMVTFGRGFPMKCKVVHRYCETVQLSSTTGVPVTYRLSTNGMYDPNHTGGGHQPLYFDQFVTLYDHYVVLASKIKVLSIINSNNSATISMLTDDDTTTTAGATPEDFFEQSSGRRPKILAPNIQPVTLNSSWSASKTFGRSVLSNTDLQGTSATNPAEQSYWTIIFQPLDKVSSATCFITVEIEYTAIWKELRDIARS